MSETLSNSFRLDPTVQVVLAVIAAFFAIVIVLSIVRRGQAAIERRKRAAETRAQMEAVHKAHEEIERLATRIIATGSTATIAGYEIVRQIEAVATDGHPTPAKAIDSLKAIAAQKGGNAIINLVSERSAGGKCFARGDAVMVRVPGATKK